MVGTEVDEEQTSEIIRMSPSSADLPSRVAAELPLAGAPTQLHVEPQARTAPAFVSSEDGKDCAGQASVRFTRCTAELPSRLLAEVPRRLVSRDSDPDCHHDTPQVSMVPATLSSGSHRSAISPEEPCSELRAVHGARVCTEAYRNGTSKTTSAKPRLSGRPTNRAKGKPA